jgi:hypothetical protein
MGGIYRIFGFEEDWNKPRCLIELVGDDNGLKKLKRVLKKVIE